MTGFNTFNFQRMAIPRRKEGNTRMMISFFKRFVLTLLCCFFTAGIGMAEKKASVVRVGIFQLAPMVYIDVNGSPKGVFVDIIDEIGKAEGWKVEYIKGSWNQGLEKVKNGEIELMTAVMHLDRQFCAIGIRVGCQITRGGNILSSPSFRLKEASTIIPIRLRMSDIVFSGIIHQQLHNLQHLHNHGYRNNEPDYITRQ